MATAVSGAIRVNDDTATKRSLVDLLDPADAAEWVLTSAMEINNRRQIVGIGLHNGKTRGFLMTPTTKMLDVKIDR